MAALDNAQPWAGLAGECLGSARQPHPGNDDAGTTLICGAYRFADGVAHLILSLLPPVIHIEAAQARGDL